VGTYNASSLYTIQTNATSAYTTTPLLLDLHGTREEIGYAYAALMHDATSYTYTSFMNSVIPNVTDQAKLDQFIDWIWTHFQAPHTPAGFLQELQGMRDWYAANPHTTGVPADLVSSRFYTLANMPADGPNIISALEASLEAGWPTWLKGIVNEIVKLLERLVHSCDAYGVFGKRATTLFSSRNLDYNKDTGINKYKARKGFVLS
jgi:hypothetical protein